MRISDWSSDVCASDLECGDEGARLGIGAAGLRQRGLPGGEVAVAAVAGGLRIRDDDADTRPDEVVPVLDVLGIAFAHEEQDRRPRWASLMREFVRPLRIDQSGLDRKSTRLNSSH